MKNSKFWLFALAGISIPCSAYTVQIWNTTPGNVRVQVYLLAGPTRDVVIPPGTKMDVDTVGWLTNKVVVYGVDNVVNNLYAEKAINNFGNREIYISYEGPEQYLPPRPANMTETDYLNVYLTPEIRTRIANMKRKLNIEDR